MRERNKKMMGKCEKLIKYKYIKRKRIKKEDKKEINHKWADRKLIDGEVFRANCMA